MMRLTSRRARTLWSRSCSTASGSVLDPRTSGSNRVDGMLIYSTEEDVIDPTLKRSTHRMGKQFEMKMGKDIKS